MNDNKNLHNDKISGSIAVGSGRLRNIARIRELAAAAVVRVVALLCPIVTFYLFDLYTHNPFVDMKFKVQLLNYVFYWLSAALLAGLFGRIRAALMCQTGLFMVVGLANYYVLKFRSTPIMPWDISSISTAVSVADNYDYTPERKAVLVLLGFILLLVLESRIRIKIKGNVIKRLVIVALSVLLLSGYGSMIQRDSFVIEFGLYDKLFTPTVMNKRDGNVVAFIMELEYLWVEKPEGYKAGEAEELYNGFESEELAAALDDPESVRRPNIIVIMNEAFSDLSVLGDFETNGDYMPFIRSLMESEDTVSGYLNVSVLGGNTANTEFEFLTGHTMAFLPQGSVAYQQYLQSETPSLASYLKQLGYETVAIHPYNAGGWERDEVYPLLGFDTFLAREDFAGERKLRKYYSDEACYRKIIDLYEEKDADQPLFVFNVTMQNHSGYNEVYSNFDQTIEATGLGSKSLNQYLSLLKESDDAFRNLVTYFSEQQEETVIVFFGDHQPTASVSNSIIKKNGMDPKALSLGENLLKYKVPYVIWSNFEMSGKEQETSVNYLAADVLESCGLPLPRYQMFQQEIRDSYPIITAMQLQDAAGVHFTDEREVLEGTDGAELLRQYQCLQYYLMFDRSE